MTFPPQPTAELLTKLDAELQAADVALHQAASTTPPGAEFVHVNSAALDALFTELRDRGQAALLYGKQLVVAQKALAAALEQVSELALQLQTAGEGALAVAKAQLDAENAALKAKLAAAGVTFGQLASRVAALEAAKPAAAIAETPAEVAK